MGLLGWVLWVFRLVKDGRFFGVIGEVTGNGLNGEV